MRTDIKEKANCCWDLSVPSLVMQPGMTHFKLGLNLLPTQAFV